MVGCAKIATHHGGITEYPSPTVATITQVATADASVLDVEKLTCTEVVRVNPRLIAETIRVAIALPVSAIQEHKVVRDPLRRVDIEVVRNSDYCILHSQSLASVYEDEEVTMIYAHRCGSPVNDEISSALRTAGTVLQDRNSCDAKRLPGSRMELHDRVSAA